MREKSKNENLYAGFKKTALLLVKLKIESSFCKIL